jgi:Flp pilus assembly pilin Flp
MRSRKLWSVGAQRGASMIEYALLVALVAVMTMAALGPIGDWLDGSYQDAATAVAGETVEGGTTTSSGATTTTSAPPATTTTVAPTTTAPSATTTTACQGNQGQGRGQGRCN